MDIERIKFLISYEDSDEGKIHTGDYIDQELIALLRTNADKRADIIQSFVNYDVVASHIRGMKYKDFLQTPYWDFVTSMKKYRADYKCELCGATKYLQVHHKSYENHGREHTTQGLKDLIVLCKNCHAKFHDKEII